MRRSHREKKKPESFNPCAAIIERDDSESGSTSENDLDDEPAERRTVNKITKSSSAKTGSPNISSKGIKLHLIETGCAIYDSMYSSKKINTEVTRWINLHKDDDVAATAELVNFVLLSAGAERCYIKANEQLIGLGPQELDELILDMKVAMSESGSVMKYPLVNVGRDKAYRQRYCQFWEYLSDIKISSYSVSEDSDNDLLVISDCLMSLSGINIIGVRDAVTEATLIISKRVMLELQRINNEKETAVRQLNSTTRIRGTGGVKSEAFKKQIEGLTQAEESLLTWWENMYRVIFSHRYKDSSETIRAVCIHYLGELICSNPTLLLKDEYLKYVGWNLSDRSVYVRKETVIAFDKILDLGGENIPKLANMINRFSERFIEVAAADKEESVAIATISVLRKMQQNGLLDDFTEAQVEAVDEIIFDDSASVAYRREALLFLLDHTHGFEIEEPVSAAADYGHRGKGNVAKSEDNVSSRQHVARQLETLAEFSIRHINRQFQLYSENGKDPATFPTYEYQSSYAELLVEACEGLPLQAVLQDWSIFHSLLLRDSDKVLAVVLDESHISFMVRLLVASVLNYVAVSEEAMAAEESDKKGIRKKRGAVVPKDVIARDAALSELFGRDLPKLLTKFKSDVADLSELCLLLTCRPVLSLLKLSKAESSKSGTSGSTGSAASKAGPLALLKVVGNLFESSSDQGLLLRLADAFQVWTRETANGWMADRCMEKVALLVENALTQMEEALATLDALASEVGDGVDSSQGSTRKRSRGHANSQTSSRATPSREDTLYALFGAAARLAVISDFFDLRSFVSQKGETREESIFRISGFLVEVLDRLSSLTSRSEAVTCSMHCSKVMISFLVMTAKDVFAKVAETNQDDLDDDDMLAATEDELSPVILCIIKLRDLLIENVLQPWLAAEHPNSEQQLQVDDLQDTGDRILKRSAFRIVGYLRNLFPRKLFLYKLVGRLAWTPPQDIVGYMRVVFEQEGGLLDGLYDYTIAASGADSDTEGRQIALRLVNDLIHPLALAIVSDIDRLNHHQAAAVLAYCSHPSDVVQALVRAYGRQIKETNVTKYLEIQLTTLKNTYSSRVLEPMRQAEQQDGTPEDHAELEEAIRQGDEEVLALGRRFSQSMGVGKAKDAMLESILTFLRNCVYYCMEESGSDSFLRVPLLYVRFLPNEQAKSLSQELRENLAAEGVPVKGVWNTFLESLTSKNIGGRPKKTVTPVSKTVSRVSVSSSVTYEDEEDEEDEEEEELQLPRRRVDRRSLVSAISKSSSRMSAMEPLVEEEEDEAGDDVDDTGLRVGAIKRKREAEEATESQQTSLRVSMRVENLEEEEEAIPPPASKRPESSSSIPVAFGMFLEDLSGDEFPTAASITQSDLESVTSEVDIFYDMPERARPPKTQLRR